MHWSLPSSRDGIGGKDRREEERTVGKEEWMVGGGGMVRKDEEIWDKL
jgi:hypothetical protein